MDSNTLIRRGSLLAAIGAAISGPIGLAVVALTKPQPLWKDVDLFIDSGAWIQTAPYYFGVLLAMSCLMLFIGYYLNQPRSAMALAALICIVLYAALVLFNYMAQIAIVPNFVLHPEPEYRSAISVLSMSNPDSICWTVEMWAYGLLGLATWFASALYENSERTIRWLMQCNGAVSLATMVATVFGTRWVLEPVGLIGFLVWNILFITMALKISFHARRSSDQPAYQDRLTSEVKSLETV
jgi:hypothetical protein